MREGQIMDAKLTARDLQQLTVTITVPAVLRWRMRVGIWVVKLGVWIFGATSEIKGRIMTDKDPFAEFRERANKLPSKGRAEFLASLDAAEVQLKKGDFFGAIKILLNDLKRLLGKITQTESRGTED